MAARHQIGDDTTLEKVPYKAFKFSDLQDL